MQFRGLTTTLTVLAATVGLGAVAIGAQASAVVKPPVVDNDGVTLIGSTELALTDGNVAFSFANGAITPHLTATLEGENADDLCVRARIDSYEGATLLHSAYSKKRCLKRDKPYTQAVDFSEVPDARTDSVIVAIEKENAQGWTTVDDSAPGFLDVKTFADEVRILGLGVDYGGDAYAGGVPTSSAHVTYDLDNGLATAQLDGFIHLEGFSNCARIQLLVLGAGPLSPVAETINGPKHCPADLSHVSFHDVLATTPSGSLNQVQIVLQTKNGGSWLNAGNQTVSIAE